MSAVIAKPAIDSNLSAIAPNARHLSASQVIRRLFRLAILFMVARLLSVEGFGSYALLLTIVELVNMLSGYGYVDFLTREVARQPDAAWPLGKKVTQLRLAYVVPGVGLALLVLTLLGFASSLIVSAALLSLALLPRAAGESAVGLLKGLQRFAPLPWIEFAQGLVVLGCVPALILQGYGLRGVIASELLGATVGAIISVWTLVGWVKRPGIDPRSLSDLLRATLVFNVYPFITNVYDRVDVVLLAKLAGTFATGIYSLPYRAFGALSIIPYSVMGALLPVFSSSDNEDDTWQTCAGAMKFLYLTALLVILLTLTFAGPVTLLLLGQSYAASIIVIKILVWAAVPSFLNYALNTLLLAGHKEKVFLVTAAVCTVFNITANLLLIPRYSFVAAAAVTVGTECLLLAQNFYLTRRFLRRAVFPTDWLKITTVFALALATFWALQRATPQILAGAVACVAFAALVTKMTGGFRAFRRELRFSWRK